MGRSFLLSTFTITVKGWSPLEIDIRKTVIIDSSFEDRSSTLETIFKHINNDGLLVIDADNAQHGGEEEPEGVPFDYRFDTEGGK